MLRDFFKRFKGRIKGRIKRSRLVRKGFGLRRVIQFSFFRDYHSSVVDKMREDGFERASGRFTIYLARAFGFCYGVRRAIELAYETRENFHDRRLFLTAEIIHNPRVNKVLQEKGFQFLTGPNMVVHGMDEVKDKDVVVIPAFGVDAVTFDILQKKGCVLVDATCGSVLNIWNRVEGCARNGFTVVIHGKRRHEETVAAVSRVLKYPRGKYLVVLNLEEAGYVAEYIKGGGDKGEFMRRFSEVVSPGFDPDRDLEKIGLANQTTMLSGESMAVAECLRNAMVKKYGEIEGHFKDFDTICSATEDRQGAVLELKDKNLNLMLVVGGYNSSNTSHLTQIASPFVKTYHIEDATCLISADGIRYKPAGSSELVVTKDWLPKGEVKVGITGGASTPDRVIGETIERLTRL